VGWYTFMLLIHYPLTTHIDTTSYWFVGFMAVSVVALIAFYGIYTTIGGRRRIQGLGLITAK
jgi:hypothetical protein